MIGLPAVNDEDQRKIEFGKRVGQHVHGKIIELDRARAEGREPRIYHGLFSSHPTPDARAVQAAKGAANINGAPPGGWTENREAYLQRVRARDGRGKPG